MGHDRNLETSRARLASQQEALLRAMVGRAPVPPGFDTNRVRVAAISLAAKRARTATGLWPALAAAVGQEFSHRFRAYAERQPLPAQGGAIADGLAFSQTLSPEESRGLGDAATIERRAVTLRHRPAGRDGSLSLRRAPSFALFRLAGSGRWLAAVRAPGLGEYWLTLPVLGIRRRREKA